MRATVRAYDPAGMQHAKKIVPTVTYCDGAYACANGADALVIVTEWEQFRALDFTRLGKIMTRQIIIDLRNIYRADDVIKHGFQYLSIGKSPDERLIRGTENSEITSKSARLTAASLKN